MPTYEYECTECGYQFEELQSFNEPPIEKCPKCGGRAQRLISPGSGLIFKGSGFYITDYARKNSSPASTNGDKTETKSTPEKKKQKKSSKRKASSETEK